MLLTPLKALFLFIALLKPIMHILNFILIPREELFLKLGHASSFMFSNLSFSLTSQSHMLDCKKIVVQIFLNFVLTKDQLLWLSGLLRYVRFFITYSCGFFFIFIFSLLAQISHLAMPTYYTFMHIAIKT
ncbi:hypothetical protein ACJX0J_040693, partial [Zea mays]